MLTRVSVVWIFSVLILVAADQHTFHRQNELNCAFEFELNRPLQSMADLQRDWYVWTVSEPSLIESTCFEWDSVASFTPATKSSSLDYALFMHRCRWRYPQIISLSVDIKNITNGEMELKRVDTSGQLELDIRLRVVKRLQIGNHRRHVEVMFVTRCAYAQSDFSLVVLASEPIRDPSLAEHLTRHFQQEYLDIYPLDFYAPLRIGRPLKAAATENSE